MDSDGDGDGGSTHSHQAKKRRVTRACDNCRRRRIKCQSYPNASLDAPCVICTDAGTPQQCTYSKPPRKRGPQAGKARSLAEKCATFERLLGYLATAIPNLEAYVTAFASQSATSPASGSNASPPMPSDSFQNTYENSRLPEILDAILPPVVSAREAAKLKLDSKVESSPPPFGLPPLMPATGATHPFGTGPSGSTDHLHGYNLPVPPPAPTGAAAGLDTVMSPFDTASSSTSRSYHNHPVSTAALAYPLAGSASTASRVDTAAPLSTSIPFALQTLADAAVPDASSSSQSSARRGEQRTTGRAELVNDGASHGSTVQIPDGPARSALLDLYFNQVVQPSLPMLDKSAFLRWSAYLPSAHSTSSGAASTPKVPSYLYFSVFALSSIYVPPSSPLRSSLPTDAPRVYASAARSALLSTVMRDCVTSGDDGPIGLEATQSTVLLALCDWAQGELDRAWTMSSLAITLAIGQSLHLPVSAGSDTSDPARYSEPTSPSPARLRTLHAVLIVHSLLSIRLERVPLSAALLDDYAGSIPPPPTDEAENWDLWRSDKTAAELRVEWTGEAESPPSAEAANSSRGGSKAESNRPLADARSTVAAALPSNSLLVFARLAELCNIGTAALRSNLRGRTAKVKPTTTTSAAGLVQQLQKWEAGLEAEVRLEATTAQGLAALVTERPRWTVAMHLLAETLRLSLLKDRSDAAESVARIAHLVELQRAVFTPFRSLPMSELVLHRAASVLAQVDGADVSAANETRQAVHGLAKTARDLSRALPVAQLSYDRLISFPGTSPITAVQAEPTEANNKAPPVQPRHESEAAERADAEPASSNLEPFQAFLSYAQDLGPTAEPSTILDFGSWDQSDLLVSLGLVGPPNAAAPSAPTTQHDPWSVWNAPIEGMMNVGEADHDQFPLPVLAETGLDPVYRQAVAGGGEVAQVSGSLPYGAPSQPGPYRMPSEQDSVSSRSAAPSDAAMISPASQMYPLHHRPEASARQAFSASATAPAKNPPVQPQMQPLPPPPAPTHQQSFPFPSALTDSAYLPRSLFGTPVPPDSNMVLDGQEAYEAALGTDLLTRWLDRGTLGFSTPDMTTNNSRSGTENA